MLRNNGELIIWTNKLSCGIKLIDDQHKGLVDLVNDMFNHVTGKEAQERDYFNMIIQEMIKYVKNHFSTEEKILLATKFSGYAEHKKEHDTFIFTVVGNIQDFQAGKRFILSNFTRFLRDWILSHIALMDKQYFEYLKKVATRKADGKLSINLKDVYNIK